LFCGSVGDGLVDLDAEFWNFLLMILFVVIWQSVRTWRYYMNFATTCFSYGVGEKACLGQRGSNLCFLCGRMKNEGQ